MKNKYLTKCLCITMAMAVSLGSTASAFATEETTLSGSASDTQTEISEAQAEETPAATQAEADPGNTEENSSDQAEESGEAGNASGTEAENPSDSAVSPVPGKDSETPSVTPEPADEPENPETPSVTPEPTGEPENPETPDVTPSVTPEPTDEPENPQEPSVTPEPTGEPENPETPDITPSVTPEPTDEPENPEEPSVTPEPTGEPEDPDTPDVTPSVTPEPTEDPTATPAPGLSEESQKKVSALVRDINKAFQLAYDDKKTQTVKSLRKTYNKLSPQEQAAVTNYKLLVEMEDTISQMPGEADDDKKDDKKTDDDQPELTPTPTPTPEIVVTPAALTAAPVYASNLHAGKEFYLNSLQQNYQLSFSDDFADIMDQIEKEYKEQNHLTDVSDSEGGVTTSADALLVRNWQDILAIYIYERSLQGETSYKLDASSKDDLAAIFARMNPVVKDDTGRISYANRHVNYYIKENKIPKSERGVLKKYLETDCKLLCATVTAAKGFVRQSVGDDVSEERVNVIAAAYSLVGKIGYFWGGKSTTIGMDPSWGALTQVTAEGSQSSGSFRAYGLDCSGFVTWAVINGYKDQAMIAAVGSGTSDQWGRANVVSEADAQPGDLVFQRGPEAGSANHVGIICGKTDAGDWIVVHCSSSKNGVTVGEAYSASFRYIRQPSFYPNAQQMEEMRQSGKAIAGTGISGIDVSNGLQALIKANLVNTGDLDTFTEDPTGNGQISPGSLYVANSLQELLEAGQNISVFSQVTYGDAVQSDASFEEADSDETGFTGIMVNNSLQELLATSIGIQ